MIDNSSITTSFLNDEERSVHKKDDLDPRREDTLGSVWESKNSLCLVLFTIFEAVIVISLEAVLFVKFNNSTKGIDIEDGLARGLPAYFIIFIFSLIFQVVFATDAVYNKNTIQVIAFILFNLCCFVYAICQFNQIDNSIANNTIGDRPVDTWPLKQLMVANPVVIGFCQLSYFYLGARLYREFGWRIYKKVGADLSIRSMYRWYQILLTILKLDFFFFLGFSIQFLILVLKTDDIEFALTIAALPLTCFLLTLAVFAIKHESKSLVALFFTGLTAGIAYFIFKIYRIYDITQSDKYKYVNQFLTFFASVTLILIVLTIINMVMCLSNFGKDLKPKLLNKPKEANKKIEGLEISRTVSLD